MRRGVVTTLLESAFDFRGILSEGRTGCQRAPRIGPAIIGPMFIVAFEGTPPPDKAEWIEILREVLAG
jgi:hypothetical protein